jgi:hypothetical protein
VRDEPVEEKLGKLRELLAPGARGDDEVELLAELLLLPSSAASLNLSPQRKRQTLFEALLQLESTARSRPVLTVLEDGGRARSPRRSAASDRRPMHGRLKPRRLFYRAGVSALGS